MTSIESQQQQQQQQTSGMTQESKYGQPYPSIPPNAPTTTSTFVNSIQDLLLNINCSNPFFPRFHSGVIAISPETTFWETLRVMMYNKILAVPIIDSTTRQELGVFSMEDVLHIILDNFSVQQLSTWSADQSQFQTALTATNLSSKRIIELGSPRPVPIVKSNAPLLVAIQHMVQMKSHRALVVNDDGIAVNMITQSRVVAVLSTVLDMLPTANRSLRELNLGIKNVVAVSRDVTAYEAFRQMRDHGISAVAVADNNGKLIGNLSIDDLKLLGYDLRYWSFLSLPVSQYLDRVHERAQLLNFRAGSPFVFVKDTDTLAFTIKLLYTHRIHRVYVADANMRLVGVVSLSDILEHVLRTFVSA